jgi:hypothetical protein
MPIPRSSITAPLFVVGLILFVGLVLVGPILFG